MPMPDMQLPSTPEAIEQLLNSPAKSKPDGSYLSHPTNRSEDQRWYYLSASLCIGVSGIFVFLRLYTKSWVTRKTDLSDYAALLAFVGLIALNVGNREAMLAGTGVHQWNVQVKNLMDVLYWTNINVIIYSPTIFFLKFAILYQYLTLFAPVRSLNPVVHIGAWTLIAMNALFYTIGVSLNIWYCTPREKIWNPFIPGHCLNSFIILIASVSLNIISDILILLLPTYSIWQLRIPRKKKAQIMLLFACGLLACGCSAAMIFFVCTMSTKDGDVTYNSLWLGLASSAEISLGLIVTSAITLPKLYQAKLKGLQNRVSFVHKSWFSRRPTARTDRISKGQTISEIHLIALSNVERDGLSAAA